MMGSQGKNRKWKQEKGGNNDQTYIPGGICITDTDKWALLKTNIIWECWIRGPQPNLYFLYERISWNGTYEDGSFGTCIERERETEIQA